MYLDFFRFKKNPFNITPDPDFLFLSSSHKEASASIFYGIEERKGFVAVTGEVGVGKTTILRSYLEGTDPDKIKIIYIFNAALAFDKLLQQIVSELGIQVGEGDSALLVDSLFHYLIEEYKHDRNVVVIIDEAQNMPVETLERLRMLSNLETSQDKLLQIILVGQPEFEDKLKLPQLRQLRQRIAVRCHIDALTPDESLAYIQHRLMMASMFHNPAFTKDALRRIIKVAKGIPRTINVLCDNALITAFGYQCNPVDGNIIREVIMDFQGGRHGVSSKWRIIWVPALGVLVGLVALASQDLFTGGRIRNVGGTISEKIQSFGAVAKPAKKPEEVKSQAGVPSQEAQGTGITKAIPKVEGLLKVESELGNEVIHSVEAPVREKRGSAVARVIPEVESLPKAEPVSSFFEPRRAAETPPKGAPEHVTSEIAAVGDEHGVSHEESKNTGALAPPSPPPQVVSPLEDRAAGWSWRSVVVKKGDNVGKLLMDANGRVDGDLERAFKEMNPQIKNIDIIREGERIVVPSGK